MALCIGGCGKETIPGGKYHCRKGEAGYQTCVQQAYRNRQPKEDNADNVIQNTGKIAQEVAEIVIAALQPHLEHEPASLPQPPANEDRLACLLEQLIDEARSTTDILRAMQKNQPRTATPDHAMQQAPARNVSDDDLMDMLEVKAAEYDSDNNSSYNFILSVAGVASGSEFNLPPEVYEYAVRTGRMKATSNNGPRQMDVPTFDEPDEDSFNDLIDLL